MIAADIELDMPRSLVAVGTPDFANTFLKELMGNVSDGVLLDHALEADAPGDAALDCYIDRVAHHGAVVVVTVGFEFDDLNAEEPGGTFEVVLDIDERRVYVADNCNA